MLKIGDFSKLCKVTIKALRYYDELGILKPDYISEENGYRFYKPDQLRKVSEIVFYKEMGFSLEEISFIILNNPPPGDVLKILTRKQSEISGIITSEEQKLSKIISFIKDLKEEKFMNSVSLKTLPEIIVASLRTKIPNYDALNIIYPQMGKKMKAHGDVCREPGYCFNIYHDGEYKETDIDVEICEAVLKAHKNEDGIIYKKIDEVKTAACFYHKGEYSTLGKSYAEVFKWIEENGYKVIDNPRESYVDGCWNKKDPSEWLTEIQVPVTK
jgi:effector-binding domain-containing protein